MKKKLIILLLSSLFLIMLLYSVFTIYNKKPVNNIINLNKNIDITPEKVPVEESNTNSNLEKTIQIVTDDKTTYATG